MGGRDAKERGNLRPTPRPVPWDVAHHTGGQSLGRQPTGRLTGDEGGDREMGVGNGGDGLVGTK